MQRESPGCAICDVVRHPTHICRELDELKQLSSEADIVTPCSSKKDLPPKVKAKHCVPITHALFVAIMRIIPIIA